MCAALALLLGVAPAGVLAATDPGPGDVPHMEFEPTPPGTYRLQHIQPSPDAVLLDSAARTRRLASYTRGKVTLLTFFYTYCTDRWGCPFAYQTMKTLRDRIIADGSASRVRFVSISFDPTHDTPEALHRYANGLQNAARFEWRFLTARSMAPLADLLERFGQDVQVETDGAGRPTRAIHHMLKVFLIDPAGIVREIYALDYLHPAVMLNDIRTLLMEADGPAVGE